MKKCSKCQEPRDHDGTSTWCRKCKAKKESERRRNAGMLQRKKSVVDGDKKECLKCHRKLLLELFPLNVRGLMGRGSYCVECDKKYHAQRKTLPGAREKQKAAVQKYRNENRDKWRFLHRCNMQARRAKKKNLDSGLVTKEFLDTLYAQETCYYCQKFVPTEDRTCDHVIPLTKFGPHHPDNLVMACGSCNSSKGDRTPDEWPQNPNRSNDCCR